MRLATWHRPTTAAIGTIDQLVIYAFKRATFCLPLFFALTSIRVDAASHYIRAGASGANDGTSWVNAWPSIGAAVSSGMIRGDTYYLAGGIYNETASIYIHQAPAGSLAITIKKANAADNSTDPGWNPTYATDVAYINGPIGNIYQVLDFAKGYVRIDGVTGTGTSGYGIVIFNPAHTDVILLEDGDGYSISHCEIRGAGFTGTTDGYSGIQWTNGKNTYIGNNWIHDLTINGVVLSGIVGTSFTDYGLLFENNIVSETGGCTDVDKHGQGLQLGYNSEMAYCIFRNSQIRNVAGSAMIAFLGGTSANHHDIQIYNNIFYITDLSTYGILSPGVIWSHAQRVAIANISIINNTFFGLGSLSAGNVSGTIVLEGAASNNTLSNNIWENCRMSGPHYGIAKESNNGYFGNILNVPTGTLKQVDGVSSTFVNAAAFDFRLVASGYALGRGRNFPSIFATDITGLIRGGVWDLGAYQDHTTADVPPTNAKVSSP